MNTYALPALRDKRAEISGKIIALRKQIARHKAELAGLDRTIKLFDPECEPAAIAPRAPRQRLHLFKQGELGRHILDTLRRAGGPLSAKEATAAVCAAIGQADAEAVMLRRVRAGLAYLEGRGETTKVGKGKEARWRLSAVEAQS